MTKKLSDIEQEAKLRKQTFYDPTLDPVFKKVFGTGSVRGDNVKQNAGVTVPPYSLASTLDSILFRL